MINNSQGTEAEASTGGRIRVHSFCRGKTFHIYRDWDHAVALLGTVTGLLGTVTIGAYKALLGCPGSFV